MLPRADQVRVDDGDVVLVEAVEAIGADARHQSFIRLADVEILVGAEVGLAEVRRARVAHASLPPSCRWRIAGHV